MFGGKQPNPYDEFVTKTTDENLTSENWELIMNLCDKVGDEGEQGARNVIAALLKRLAHRNPNVQLYALALAEALSKNCGIELHREMASRAFTQGLEKLVTDRTTHEKVKRRALHLISLWSGEFENNPQLGLMEELCNTLKSKNFKFDEISEPPPPNVDDEIRRREEEELQRVLEMSVHDKGGRNVNAWKSTTASSSAEVSSSSAHLPDPSSSGGYTPIDPPSSAYPASEMHHRTSKPQEAASTTVVTVSASSAQQSPPVSAQSSSTTISSSNISRVRALYTFEPTVAGELAFEKGDIIKVTDRAYDNWWRGQLRGRTGIFPVNYVEPLPDPTPSDLAREAEQEAAVFAQATNIDKLISMLKGLDPSKDNLADNEEIQELYRSSMSLRPKIVKLIDKYSQKRAELVTMNENFVKARGVFEQMMEESLARHTGVYDNTQPTFRTARPDSRANATDYRASTYGWNPALYDQPGYNAYPAAPAAYVGGEQQRPQQYSYQAQAYGEANAYVGQRQPSTYSGQTPQGPQSYPAVDGYNQQQHSQGQTQASQQSQSYGHPTAGSDHSHTYGYEAAPIDPAAYAQQNPQWQAQSQAETQPQQSQPQSQPIVSQSQDQQGPPYIYDPTTQYADPNVQAWAQYYAQGGKDAAGAVYFVSVPGVTDASGQTSVPSASGHPASQAQSQALPTASEVHSSQPSAQPTSSTLSAATVQLQPAYPGHATGSARSTTPPADLAQYPAQPAYQTYDSTPAHTAPPLDVARHPHLHIQPGKQATGNTMATSPEGLPDATATASYGPVSVDAPQSYATTSYAPSRGATSPIREGHTGYQPQAQFSSTTGLQQSQAPLASERVGS